MAKHLSVLYCYISILIVVFVLNSCNSQKQIESSKVFRYNEYRNVTSLDPAFSRNPQNIWPINQLFNGLVQLNKKLEIVPEIANSWTISSDGLTYVFNLREDVYFHTSPLFGPNETRKVVADDFVYSFDRLKDPKIASPGGWVLQQVDEYEATEKHIFTIRLKNPFPAFLGILTMRYCSVVPKEVESHFGENFRSNPIGTGPFYFKRWDETVSYTHLTLPTNREV